MFTTTPEHYGSLHKSQIFKFSSTYTEDHTYVIKEVNSGEIIGVKKFYLTNSSSLNVAPIVRPYAVPKPSFASNQFLDSTSFGNIAITVTESGSVDSSEVTSDERIFTLSKSDESECGLLTTLPMSRTMSFGESELLLYRCEPSSSIEVTVNQYRYNMSSTLSDDEVEPDATESFRYNDDGDGYALFSISTEPFEEMSEEDFERIVVTISTVTTTNGVETLDEVERLKYYLIDPPKNPMRLVWVSSRGSLEHYTMPYMVSESVLSDGSREYTLRSALETYEVREALSEIISAEAVWAVFSEEYIEVEVTSDEIELSPEQDLATIQFKISYSD